MNYLVGNRGIKIRMHLQNLFQPIVRSHFSISRAYLVKFTWKQIRNLDIYMLLVRWYAQWRKIVSEGSSLFLYTCIFTNYSFDFYTFLIWTILKIISRKWCKLCTYMVSTYSKFEFTHKITESQAFVFVFARKTTEFLMTAKHWLS